MEFLPKRELWRRLKAANRIRQQELKAMGSTAEEAAAQATKEFGIYDRFQIDERGWMRIEGLDLSGAEMRDEATESHRRPASDAVRPNRFKGVDEDVEVVDSHRRHSKRSRSARS